MPRSKTTMFALRLSASVRATTVISIWVAQFFLLATCVQCQDNNNSKEILVPLSNLPELFSNDKLPGQDPGIKNDKCFNLLGCIKTLPNTGRDYYDADKIKAEFKIYRRASREQYVAYEPMSNCLSGSSGSRCDLYPYNLSAILESPFDPKLRTVILIGGYMSAAFEDWQLDTRDAWFELEDLNVIVASWTGGAGGLYQVAVSNTKLFARQITVLLYYLAKLNNLELADGSFSEKIYLIGHSLGAHISGFVGQDFGGQVGRITGLDPAGPKFSSFGREDRLDRSDAQLVDAIHTNGGNLTLGKAYFGLEAPVGHLDYYANDGKHQPGCKADALGCSHRTAYELFIYFLKQEQYMREHFNRLNRDYHDCNRIFAYRADQFEEFHNGSSLSQRCPITTLADNDLFSEDINQCLVPVDFVTWFDRLRHELASRYNISFEPEAHISSEPPSNRYFFYTSAKAPYLSHHNLIKVRVSKQQQQPNQQARSKSEPEKRCDIQLDIKMANGLGAEHEIKQYKLIDEGDHYEIIVPFLSPNTLAKYSLATLDTHDFYTNDSDKLISGINGVFPSSVVINGLVIGDQSKGKEAGGRKVMDAIKNFFGLSNKRTKNKDSSESISTECDLNIESVSVQPMKRLHRHFVATYSVTARNKPKPDLMFMFDANSSLPKISLLPKANNYDLKESNGGDENLLNSEIFIDTVILGPRNEKLDANSYDPDDNSFYQDQEQPDNYQVESANGNEKNLWLWLTVLTIVLIIIISSVSLYRMLSAKRNSINYDKNALISE